MQGKRSQAKRGAPTARNTNTKHVKQILYGDSLLVVIGMTCQGKALVEEATRLELPISNLPRCLRLRTGPARLSLRLKLGDSG